MDIASLKVADLKNELRARGITTTGTKSELVARLVQAMTVERQDDSVLDDELLEDEDSMLGDEDDLDTDVLDSTVGTTGVTSTSAISSSSPVKTTPTPTIPAVGSTSGVITSSVGSTSPVKKVLVTSNQNSGGGEDEAQKRKKLTINRDPVEPAAPAPSIQMAAAGTEQKTAATTKAQITAPGGSDSATATKKPVEAVKQLTAEERAKLRQQKFGAGGAAAATGTSGSAPIVDEKLKKRAEKFGTTPDLTKTPAKISLTTEESIRLAKRKERFGVVEESTGPTAVTVNKGKAGISATSTSPTLSRSILDENKLKRAARFMLGGANSAEIEAKKKARADRFK